MNFDQQLHAVRQRLFDACQALDNYAQADTIDRDKFQHLYLILQEAADDYFMVISRRIEPFAD